MQSEKFRFEGFGGMKLTGFLWLPEDTPRGIVQITHGTTEHTRRFAELAAFLTEHRFAVAGFDLRGHGELSGKSGGAAFSQDDWEASIQDMHLFCSLLKNRFPKIPCFMLGFSMGSFLLQEYLGRFPDGIAGSAILGTGHQPGFLLDILTLIMEDQGLKYGFDASTPLVRRLFFRSYNRKFQPSRTPADWFCSDDTQLDCYLDDSLCRKNISVSLFLQLLESMKRLSSREAYQSWNRHMPVLLLSGLDDPVGDFGKGILRISSRLKQLGMQDVTVQLLPQARHDVLHEEHSGAAGLARKMLLDWLVKVTG